MSAAERNVSRVGGVLSQLVRRQELATLHGRDLVQTRPVEGRSRRISHQRGLCGECDVRPED